MIYMDNAATSWPKPDCVYNAVANCMKKYAANPGRSAHSMSLQAGRIILYAREMLLPYYAKRRLLLRFSSKAYFTH